MLGNNPGLPLERLSGCFSDPGWEFSMPVSVRHSNRPEPTASGLSAPRRLSLLCSPKAQGPSTAPDTQATSQLARLPERECIT